MISKNRYLDNWTLRIINIAMINVPIPIIVDTWLGPKPPEVAKLEEVVKTKSSKLGVFK